MSEEGAVLCVPQEKMRHLVFAFCAALCAGTAAAALTKDQVRRASPRHIARSSPRFCAAPEQIVLVVLTVRAAFCPLPPQLNVLQSFGVSKLQELNLEQVRRRTGGGCAGLCFPDLL